jgi:hypothetical protein
VESSTQRNHARKEKLEGRREEGRRHYERRHDELQRLYQHLVPFHGLRGDLVLLGREFGFKFRDVVLATAATEVVILMVAPLILVVCISWVLYLLDALVWVVVWATAVLLAVALGALACCALRALLSLGESLGRPAFHYAYHYRQRQRLRDSQDTCSVCLGGFCDAHDAGGDLGDGPSQVLLCGHRFHCSCIQPWLSAHAYCPLCRAY